MLIRDKVPPRFRSHFCFVLFCVPLFLLGGVILLRRNHVSGHISETTSVLFCGWVHRPEQDERPLRAAL